MKPLKNLLLLPIICLTLLAATVATAETSLEDTRRQAELGDAAAQYTLGSAYYKGEGIKEDKSEAVRWYRKAAEQGYVVAQFELGLAYDSGGGVKEDKIDAVRWYRKAAEQGYAAAQYNLGVSYSNGEGIKKDKSEAAHWYRKATEQGHAKAQFNLGLLYDNGEGVKENKSEAAHWYRKAAEQGHTDAQSNLGIAYYLGKGVKEDKQKAVHWLHKAAEQGNATAQFNLGIAYNTGKGVKGDEREATHWFRKAAEQGNVSAQFNLGVAYDIGRGVKEDKREAARWLRKAAEQGNASAQLNLGVAYDIGAGVKENKREAVRWVRKAAEQGLAKAQFSLGAFYWKGEGVVSNKQLAYTWFIIAKASGYKVEDLLNNRWDSLLTPNEIRSAKREATRRFIEIEKRQDLFQSTSDSPSADVEFSVASPSSEINIAAKVFKNTWRSVVMIKDGEGQGSGVVIRPNLVATACHVVNGGDIAIYKPDNKRIDTNISFHAIIRHRDDARDFCILEVDGLWSIPATIRKYDTLNIGENVYAIGAPQGLDMSLSDGLVSQLRNTEDGRIIQTNTAISPGSSGGGLFDTEGNLIGIVTSKLVDENTDGIAFAIPADLALEI